MSIRSLYWFTNDLRISDNPLLAQAAQNSHQLTCCYLLPSLTPLEQRFQVVASNGLAKQTALYDPELSFIRRWQGEADHHSIDVVDMVDWPVSPAQ
ncbi:deoxyribodipyrimidine photo-lyase [Vibrio injensis]|uniref:deoxyribodipyrimidine photo-lyase n=1 Tax=Vibrio injensis TaxID=1307414 RepID=UPI003B009CD1